MIGYVSRSVSLTPNHTSSLALVAETVRPHPFMLFQNHKNTLSRACGEYAGNSCLRYQPIRLSDYQAITSRSLAIIALSCSAELLDSLPKVSYSSLLKFQISKLKVGYVTKQYVVAD